MDNKAHLFTIPSGVPFAEALAQGLLADSEGDPLTLSQSLILLPSRRACRTVRDAFLRQSAGRPLLLPRLQPLGDVEEEELTIAMAGAESNPGEALLTLPPAMPPVRRRILLARALLKTGDALQNNGSIEQALALADDLQGLMDQIYTENLTFERLPALVEGDLARHWQLTTDFLKILSEVWPHILAANGMIDAADRRNRLLRGLAAHWCAHPPSYKVVAAGSTGSIPATGALLSVIARMPQGTVVLPGLDTAMDQESWEQIDDTHPQATLKALLGHLGAERHDAALWPAATDAQQKQAARRRLITEIMRPAATTDRWNSLKARTGALTAALQGLRRYDCETEEDEAGLISLMLRHTLEDPAATAALITPDRALARRVAAHCRRWGVEIDDSGGVRLHDTTTGLYLRLVMQAALTRLAPGVLLSLLRHDLCSIKKPHRALERVTGLLEKTMLRGSAPPPGFEGLRARAGKIVQDRPHLERAVAKALGLIDDLEPILIPLLTLCDGQAHPADLWLTAHIEAAENLAATAEEDGAARLWRGEAGETASRILSSLLEETAHLPALDATAYLAVLTQIMAAETVRPRYGTHPRLAILGQIEARLLQADLVVLGGLNERSWPQGPGHDPFMSRPMRAAFGLPSPERTVGLAAHDFVQGFCAQRVVLTRARRQQAAPTVPARWLQRLDAVLQAAGLDPALLSRDEIMPLPTIAHGLDRAAMPMPAARPAPCPPVERRPRILPVTAIETWLKDPYALYAKYVLTLRKLDPLERPPDAAARGILLHDVLNEFIGTYKDGLPPDSARILTDLGHARLARMADDSGFWLYWLPRFGRIAVWLAAHEAAWRERARPMALETEGSIVLDGPAGPFTLTARADRIDALKAGGAAIIDYKTGGDWTAGAMTDGKAPQLPLEGLILDKGGFPGVKGPAEVLAYWKLSGGTEAGKPTGIEGGIVRQAIDKAQDGLAALIAVYDDPAMPYFSLPDPARLPRFQDYAHLARVQEWAVADDSDEGDMA